MVASFNVNMHFYCFTVGLLHSRHRTLLAPGLDNLNSCFPALSKHLDHKVSEMHTYTRFGNSWLWNQQLQECFIVISYLLQEVFLVIGLVFLINGRSNRNARRGRYGSSTFLNSTMQCSDSFCLFVRFSPSVRSSLLTAGRQAAIACDRPSLWNSNPGDQDCPILEVRIANSLSQESQSYSPGFFDKVSVFA